jgi:cytoskeletal protein CcmA (bactofilin family)
MPEARRVGAMSDDVSVTVHGAVRGELVAQDGIRLGSDARVEGDVTCRTLAIEEGAFFVGRSVMSDRGPRLKAQGSQEASRDR